MTQNSQVASRECETCRENPPSGICGGRGGGEAADPRTRTGVVTPDSAGQRQDEEGERVATTQTPLVPTFSSSLEMAFVLDLQGKGLPSPHLLGLSERLRSPSLGV